MRRGLWGPTGISMAMRKNVKVILAKESIDFQNPRKDLLAGLHLARLTNALRAKQRSYYLHFNFEKEISKLRAIAMNFDLLLNALASIFETWKKACQIERDFHIIDSIPDENLKTELRDFIEPKDDRYSIIEMAKYVRNRMVYHFDDRIIQSNIHKFADQQEIVLVRGDTDSTVDAYFSFVDDILITDILERFGSNFRGEKNVYGALTLKTYSFLHEFASACDKIVFQLLKADLSGTHEGFSEKAL